MSIQYVGDICMSKELLAIARKLVNTYNPKEKKIKIIYTESK